MIIPKTKPNITFQGQGYTTTAIVWNDTANSANGTFYSGSVQVFSTNFIAKNISFMVYKYIISLSTFFYSGFSFIPALTLDYIHVKKYYIGVKRFLRNEHFIPFLSLSFFTQKKVKLLLPHFSLFMILKIDIHFLLVQFENQVFYA